MFSASLVYRNPRQRSGKPARQLPTGCRGHGGTTCRRLPPDRVVGPVVDDDVLEVRRLRRFQVSLWLTCIAMVSGGGIDVIITHNEGRTLKRQGYQGASEISGKLVGPGPSGTPSSRKRGQGVTNQPCPHFIDFIQSQACSDSAAFFLGPLPEHPISL